MARRQAGGAMISIVRQSAGAARQTPPIGPGQAFDRLCFELTRAHQLRPPFIGRYGIREQPAAVTIARIQ